MAKLLVGILVGLLWAYGCNPWHIGLRRNDKFACENADSRAPEGTMKYTSGGGR